MVLKGLLNRFSGGEVVDLFSTSTSCKVAAIIGLLTITFSVAFATSPDILNVVDWRSTNGQFVLATFNLAFGSGLLWAASSSRFNYALQILGFLALVEGVFYFFAPASLVTTILEWWLVEEITLTRIMSVMFGLPVGAFIVFSALALPNQGTEKSADA